MSQEAQLRVQLQTEDLMMTSMTEKFRETSGSEESCPQLTRGDDCSSKRIVAGIYSLYFLDGRAARLINRVRSEGFDALMTLIGKGRRDPSVMNTRASTRREPRGCCLMQTLKSRHWNRGTDTRRNVANRGDYLCPVLETFVFEFSGWPSRLKTWPDRVRLSMEILAKSDTKLPDQTIDVDKLRNWVAVVDEERDLNPNTWSSGQGELVQTYVS